MGESMAERSESVDELVLETRIANEATWARKVLLEIARWCMKTLPSAGPEG
jgi:hypothetical protein